MQPFDLWDQVTITEITRAAVDRVLNAESDRIAAQFAPRNPTRLEKIARGQIKLKALGKARGIVADDATPPIFRPEMAFTQEAFSLLRIAEMTPVEESLRRQLELNGTDAESVSQRDRAGASIIMRARALQIRQENLSDFMVMRAFQDGVLPIKVVNPPAGSQMQEFGIDYEFPSGNLGVVTTSFADPNANHITVLRAMQQQAKDRTGRYATDFWMGTKVWNYILNSAQVRSSFTWNAPSNDPYIATEDMVKRLLWEPQNITFHITDAGWYDEPAGFETALDTSKTRWIDEDRVLALVPSTGDGEPTAEVYDGMVPVQTNWNSYEYRGPGAQSYVQLIQGNLTLMWRQECRRLPMIHHPERIVSYKVVI